MNQMQNLQNIQKKSKNKNKNLLENKCTIHKFFKN